MAQQHGRKRTGSGGKAGVSKKERVGSSRPAGKTGGYSSRPSSNARPKQPRVHNSYGKVTHGNTVERGVLTSLLGLGESNSSSTSAGTGSIFSLSGIFSLLKQNKTARIIAIILGILLVYWLISGGNCGSMSLLDSMSGTSSITESLGIANEGTSNDHGADLSVSNEARSKFTTIPEKDAQVTIMVYMCGTDLESKYGMATADLKEMISADFGDNVNLIVETGGTQKWNNSNVSNSNNQIYRVTSNGMILLENLDKKSMVEPGTLSEFIGYCRKNYPADRYGLIFWDHGGGSVSGYGYDQYYSGSMTLDEMNTALRDGACMFDFIGFDACLMATLETALVCEQYADYLIASEETEPGVGWYYTDWLTVLSRNSSMSTVELGKHIIDDFVETCAKRTPRDKTTLSIIDLAEVKGTVPESFNAFAASTSELISNNNYKQISDARSKTREFASNINQVDLIDLANRIGTAESRQFADTLAKCVKYNRTSGNITNANGISIFFPYGSGSSVNSAIKTYDKIGLDDTYSECIKEFASVTAGGQIANGGGGDLLGSLLGSLTGGSAAPAPSTGGSLLDLIGLLGGGSQQAAPSGGNSDLLGTMLNLFLSNAGSKDLTGIDVGQDEEWFNADRVMQYEDYIAANYLDPDRIVITENTAGAPVVSLTEEEWDLVQSIELNVFFDDGEGFLDLGMDSIFERDEANGDLFVDYDGMWVTIDGQIVSYYMLSEQYDEEGEDYFITGYVPAMLNGEQVQIIVTFDSKLDGGRVAGYRPVYDDPAAPVAKTVTDFIPGDRIDFICDYYTYDMTFEDSYYIGNTIVYDGSSFEVSDMELDLNGGRVLYSYCLTDIYGNQMWTAQTEYTAD